MAPICYAIEVRFELVGHVASRWEQHLGSILPVTQNHDMFATSSSLLRMPSWLKDNVKNLKKWMNPQPTNGRSALWQDFATSGALYRFGSLALQPKV